MSVFQPIDPRVGNERRKALLAKLAQRFSGGPAGGGIGSPGGGVAPGAGTPFRAVGNLRSVAAPRITQVPHGLPPFLAALLGPGGVGRAIPGEFSPAMGSPIARVHGTAEGPRIPINASPTDSPVMNPNAPIAALPGPSHAPPVTAMSPVGSASVAPGGAPTPPPAVQSGLVQNVQAAGSPNLIPLGNGLVYDPIADQVISPAAGTRGLYAE